MTPEDPGAPALEEPPGPLPYDEHLDEEPGPPGWTSARGHLPDGSWKTLIYRGDPEATDRFLALNPGQGRH